MVSPFTSNPFERQTQSFLERLRADEERQRREIAARAEQRAKNLQLARKRQAEQQQSQLASMQAQSYLQDPLSRTVQPGSGFELTPTTPVTEQPPVEQPEERFEFGSFPGSGVLENVAKKSLDVIEPAINTATGVVARGIIGDQEFDKQLRKVMEEREAAGKPGGIREFLAAGTEASRRADPLQRGTEIIASSAFTPLATLTPGDLFGVEKQFQELRKKYYEEETGESWDEITLTNMNADIRATRRAYQEIDLPKYVKGTLEFLTDPLNFIPYIGIVNDIKTASKLARATAVGGTRLTVAGATTGAKAAIATPGAIREIPSTTGAAVQNLKARINFAKEPLAETFDYEAAVTAKRISETIKATEEYNSWFSKIGVRGASKTPVKGSGRTIADLQKQLDEANLELDRARVALNEAGEARRAWGKNTAEQIPEGATNAEYRVIQQRNINKVDRLDKNVKDARASREAAMGKVFEAEDLLKSAPYANPRFSQQRDLVNAIETKFAVDPSVRPVATSPVFTLDTFNEIAVPLLDLQGATVLNKPGAYSSIITPYKLDWAANKTAKYYDETSEFKLGTVSEVMFGDSGQAATYIRTQQASRLQGWVRDSLNYTDKVDPSPVTASLKGVINKITPNLLTNMKQADLGAEYSKYALMRATAGATAESTAQSVTANSGIASTVFGKKLTDSAIIEVSERSGKAIKSRLRKRYNNAAKRAGISADNVLASPQVSPNKFHETDLANAVVDTIAIQNSQNLASNIYIGINKAFRYEGSEFWNFAENMPTRQGHYLIERTKAFTEMNKMMDEAGIEIRTASGKVLTGMERVQHLLDEGAFVSRFVASAKNSPARDSLENYFTKARTLTDPYELLKAVEEGLSYASPEDVLKHYTKQAYNTVVDKSFNVRLVKLFKENPELAKRFGVTKVTKDAKGFQIASNNRVPVIKLKLANKEPLEPSKLNTLFESLVFKDQKSASRFASQFDVLIDDPSNTYWVNFKARLSRGGLLKGAEDVGRVLRMAGTGIDMGLLAIYGTIIFGKSNVDILRGIATKNDKLITQGKDLNKALANATVDSFLALFSPDNIRAKIYKDRALLEKASRANLTLSKSSIEAFEALSVNGPITKFLGAGPDSALRDIKIYKDSSQWVRKNLFDRFENGWSTFIDSVKLDSFDALTKNLDEVADAEEISQIADFINKGTGTLSSEAAGISKLQRQIETAFMFFSPRMTRSIIALLSDATTRGGVQGQLAREGALGAWMSLQAYTWGVGQLLGQDVNLDPSEPHYLQVKIGNSWVGPSGQIISVPRALYRTAAGPDDAAALYNDLNSDGGYKDATWFRLIRERALAAPTGSMVANAITNQDYYGQPYEGFLDFAEAESKNLLPFWLQDVVAGDPYSTDAFATAAAFGGLRTRALTSYERRRLLLDEAATEKFKGVDGFKDLSPIQVKQLYADLDSEESTVSVSDNYKAVNAVIEDQRRKNGADPTNVDEYYAERESLRNEKEASIQKLALDYETNPDIKPADFAKLRKQNNAEFAPRYKVLHDEQGKYADAHAYIKRRDSLDETEHLEEVWIDAYKTQVLFNPEFEKQNAAGINYHDFDGQDDATRQFVADYGETALKVAREYYDSSSDTHPVTKEQFAMLETFRWYWEVPKSTALEAASIKYGIGSAELRELLSLSQKGTSDQQRALGQNEIVKYINKYQSDTKESLRKNNLALEIFLVRFGYADNFSSDQMKQDPSALSFATQKTQIGPDQYASYGALIPSGL